MIKAINPYIALFKCTVYSYLYLIAALILYFIESKLLR